eukprot:13120744-Ditylum_brightwellii.AAC.1
MEIGVVKKYNGTVHSVTNEYPEYTWSGIQPPIHHLIPWGCVIYPCTHHSKALKTKYDGDYYMGITNRRLVL